MFGIFNLTREEALRAKEQKNENIDEPCYGGCSSRLDYEYCKNRRLRGSTALLYLAVFLLFGMTAAAAGIVAYDFIQENRMLYFPGNPEIDECADTMSVQRSSAPMEDDITLVAVSSDQSVRYRIPLGVMIKGISSTSDKYSGFIAGDIIVAVDGAEISTLDELRENYDETKESVFRVFRQNRYIDISVNAGN